MVHCTYMYIGLSGYNLKKNIVFCLKTNSVYPDAGPDEMEHYAAFHVGLNFLQKNSFRDFPNTNG